MNFWKNSKPNYSRDESERAEMLEVYTRWLKGEKLSRNQKRLLKAMQEYPELEPLKQLIDFAHYRFRETESIMPRPGAKQRVSNELMKRIGCAEELSTITDDLEWQIAYSQDAVGSDSELAYSPVSSHPPPPSPQPVEPPDIEDDSFLETVIIDGENVTEQAVSPLVDIGYQLKLRIVQGEKIGREYNIIFPAKAMTVGRSKDAHLRLSDSTGTLSRVHARFDMKKGELYVTDVSSTNGTLVDGVRIEKPTRLTQGTTIQLGGVICEVVEIGPLSRLDEEG